VAAWTGLVHSLWLGLTGRTWLINAYGAVMGVFWLALVVGGALLFYTNPEAGARIKDALPWLLGAALAVKAIAAVATFRALHQPARVPAPDLALAASLWALIVLFQAAMIVWLIPADAKTLATTIAAVALLTPLTRLAAAPLALAWNRHR
jgi:hypothetical protein